MYKQHYQLANFCLLLELPEKMNIMQLATHLPEIKETENTPVYVPSHLTLSIHFQEDNNNSLNMKHNKVFIKGNWNQDTKNDIPHLAYALFRQCCINNNMYPIHSIVVNNYLLIGHSGQGKTTLVLEAINQKCEIFSTDKTVVEFKEKHLMANLGTSVISVRKHLSHLINENKTPILEQNERVLCTYHKTLIQPNIKKVILFNLTNTREIPLMVEKLSSQNALHQLYPYFLDIMKQDVLLSNNLLFESNIKTESKNYLINNLKTWLKTHEVYFYSGSKECVIQALI